MGFIWHGCARGRWVLVILALAVIALAGSPRRAGGAAGTGRIPSWDCARCHGVQPAFSHPTGKMPTFKLPAGFPLENGQIVCTTCHLDTATEHEMAQTAATPMLRMSDKQGREWCEQCHAGATITRQAQHPGAVGRAHVRGAFKGNEMTKGLVSRVEVATYEDTSRSCLGCHDGTVSRDGYPAAGAGIAGAHAYKGHPVDVPYNAEGSAWAVRGQWNKNLVAMSELDTRVRFVDDRVTCTSCHSLYSREPGMLVKSNSKSALCLSCHQWE